MAKDFVINNAASASDLQLVAGVSGKRIRVIHLVVQPDASVAVTFSSGTAGAGGQTALTGPMKVSTSGMMPGFSALGMGSVPLGHFITKTGEGLVANFGAAIQVSGYGSYEEVN